MKPHIEAKEPERHRPREWGGKLAGKERTGSVTDATESLPAEQSRGFLHPVV